MNMLPKGKRVDDPPKKSRMTAWRFRLQLAVYKYPIQMALLVALVILLIPVYMLVESNAQLRNSNERLTAANSANERLNTSLVNALESSSRNRAVSARTSCDAINANALANNEQTTYFQKLIIGGAKQSGVFEDLYREFGAPPYTDRVKQAKKTARRLDRFKVAVLDCNVFTARITCDLDALTQPELNVEECIRRRTERRPG